MRLIDADKIINDLEAMRTQFDAIALDGLIRGIEEQPTIEAEPIVRCRDCRKRRSRECPMCDCEQLWDEDDGWVDAFRDRTVDEGYCHMGAKMDGGEK